MERFAAMVAGRHSAPAPAAAEEKVEGKEEGDEEYLRIQLEEIVIVKNDAYDTLAAATAAAHADGNGKSQCSGAASSCMDKYGKAAAVAAAPGGGPTTGTAARSAWATVARIIGFD